MSSRIVLFDLDGTLTPARMPMEDSMLDSLIELGKVADIGIVTGSKWEYIQEQCPEFLSWAWHADTANVIIMPCNGTQLYLPSSGGSYESRHHISMKEQLGDENYRRLVWILANLQTNMMEGIDIPISGNFISYRGSLLNWCMIGRDATNEEREKFVELDAKYNIRTSVSPILQANLQEFGLTGVEHVIGGSTSIDIYPSGWDKRYALNHVKDYSEIYFVGDRCFEGGNDWALYNAVGEDKGYKVGGPHETIAVIGGLLNKFKNENNTNGEVT